MARARPAIGVALGSGGARGWCHIGVLQALRAMGHAPDMAAGCSMGALVGAAWAGGRLDALADWARGLTQAGLLRYIDLDFSGGGLVEGKAVATILAELGLPDTFEALDKPFLAVATDMETGREVWLNKGPLFPAIRASVAIPGLFRPGQVDGRWLLDGGLVNPVPVSACRALGAGLTLAVNPNGRHGANLWQPKMRESIWHGLARPELLARLPVALRQFLTPPTDRAAPPGYIDVVSTSLDIMTDFLRKSRAAVDPPHLQIEADLGAMMTGELYRADEAIAEGRRMVEGNADAIAALFGT